MATGPRPLWSWASITRPLALRLTVGPQFKNLGQQLDRFQQIIDADVLFGRGLAIDGLSAPILGHEIEIGQVPV